MTLYSVLQAKINKSGQALGRKGLDTRRRILEILEPLIEITPLGALSVAQIAKAAGVSPSTFYLYFDNVGEAVLAVLHKVEEELDAVADLMKQPWRPEEIYASAWAFTEAYFRCWMHHGAVLKLRNYYADRGDVRFVDLRIRAANSVVDRLTAKLGASCAFRGGPTIPADSVAAVAVVAMERMATVAALQHYPPEAMEWERSAKAIAHVLSLLVSNGEDAAT
jgi:AcrR family transcriptional regulator